MRHVLLAAMCGLLLTTYAVPADEAPPLVEPKKDIVIDIEVTDGGTPRLIVPEKFMEQLKLESKSRVMLDRTQTIVAGVAMSLAIALGGLWMARKNSRTVKTLVVVAAPMALIAMLYSTSYADKAVSPAPSVKLGTLGNITVMKVKEGDVIKLQVGRDDLLKAQQELTKK
jgi:hypothetical protein